MSPKSNVPLLLTCLRIVAIPAFVAEELEGHLMENDKGQTRSFLVARVDDETLTIDGNNPLCGREVVFRLEILAVRDATDKEMKAGGAIARSRISTRHS